MLINATVRHPELEAGIAKQREATAAAVVEHAKLMGHKNRPGSMRNLKHSEQEETYEAGEVKTKKVTKTTVRRNR